MPASLVAGSSTFLAAVAGTSVNETPAVLVKDQRGAPIGGIQVTFAVGRGGGSLTGAAQVTNAAGIAKLGNWTLGAEPGINTVTASAGSLPEVIFTVSSVEPGLGTLLLKSVTTANESSLLDPDGYGVVFDSQLSQAIGAVGQIKMDNVAAGSHTVTLTGLSDNCSVVGPASRVIEIAVNAVTIVAFDVLCVPLPNGLPTLVFVSNRDGNPDIYTARTDGTGLRRLTMDFATDRDPVWSPDGNRIAFASNRDTPHLQDIYVMNADGSNIVRCTSTGFNSDPTWSSDGRRIAFTREYYQTEDQSYINIFAIDTNPCGANPVQLTSFYGYTGYAGQPAWSPDGKKIAFVSDRAGSFEFLSQGQLYIMNADGSDVTRLLPPPSAADAGTLYYKPAWSPDGKKIAMGVCVLRAGNCYPNSTIGVVQADGSDFQLVNTTDDVNEPAWSPDGSMLALSSTGACRNCLSIRYMRVDGSSAGTVFPNGYSPHWRP